MRQTISVKFFARRDRATDDGLAPVFMRVGVDGKRLNISTKIYVKPIEWSVQNCKLKTNNEEARRVNKLLEGFKFKAFDYQRELMAEGKEITLDSIKAKWYGTPTERPRMLMEVFKKHNEQMKALVNSEFSPLTLERYETSFRHTQKSAKFRRRVVLLAKAFGDSGTNGLRRPTALVCKSKLFNLRKFQTSAMYFHSKTIGALEYI